jgi:beta-lactamase regulating signal transducer with metallopeptidase domain
MTWDLLVGGSKSVAEFGLTWLCQSSALLALGLVAGRLLRRQGPAVQSAAYRTTLLAVLVCPIASTLLARAGFDGITLRLPVATPEAADATRATIDDPAPLEIARREPLAEAIEPPIETASKESNPMMAVEASPTLPPPAKPLVPEINRIAAGVAAGLSAWALGSLVMALRLAIGLRAMARLRGSAIPAGPEAEALCLDVASRMRLAAPEVLRAPFLHSPCIYGLRRPTILLPDDSGSDLRDTFVHELAHLARRDVWWNLLRHLASALLWFQPLLWVLSRRIEVTAEEVCDDYVVQFGADRASYAGLLLELARRTMPPTAATAVGMVSLRSLLSRRIVRILDSSRSLSTRAGTRALLLMLIAGLAGTVFAGLLGIGEPRTIAAVPTDRLEGDAPTRTVTGRVVDPDGRPVANATVTAARFLRSGIGPYDSDLDRRGLERAVADVEGRFTLTFEDLDPASFETPTHAAMTGARVVVVATVPGKGPGWAALPKSAGNDRPLTLTVPRDDVPIVGRLVDLEGRPVAGATVKVVLLYRPEDPGAIDRWRATLAQGFSGDERPRSHYFPIANERGLPGSEAALPAPVTTDADGRFRIEGLGRDRLATLEVTGPTAVFHRFEVVTRKMSRVEGRHLDNPGVLDSTYHGAEPTLVVEPSRPVEGVVRDLDTKTPIPYATITAEARVGSTHHIGGLIAARADADGRYRLVGLPKGKGNLVGVYPPADQPYFVTHHLDVPDSGPGLGPVPFDIELKRGIWIGGRVTDAKTGAPVAAEIHYDPFAENRNARGFANFDANRMSIPSRGDLSFTDKDGRFRVVGLPGRGILGVKSVDRSYRLGSGEDPLPTYGHARPEDFQALAEIDPPVGKPEFNRDLALEPGPTLDVQLVDAAGKPVPGAGAWGRYPEGLDDGNNDLWGSRTRVAVDPNAPKTVVFYHRDRKLAATLLVKPGDEAGDASRTVALRPCPVVAGRLVDAEGKPTAGVISIRATDPEDLRAGISHVEVATGEDGRFRVDDLPPAFHYTIRVKDRGDDADQGGLKRFRNFDIAKSLALEAGQVLDLGTFEVRRGRRVDRPAPAEVEQPQPAEMPINGRIVDLEGRPVAGVSVKSTGFRKAKGGDLTPWLEGARRGDRPGTLNRTLEVPELFDREATTDRDGRFRIEGVGGERYLEFEVTGRAIAPSRIGVATLAMEPIVAGGFPNRYGAGSLTIYGADFTHIVAPSRAVEGVVKDAKTGTPLAGAEVRSYRFAGSETGGIMTLRARVDDQGRFRLVGMPRGKGNQVIVVPTDDQPYLLQAVDLPDPPGADAVAVELALPKGIWIEGTLTEQSTGKPVAGARLHYLPFRENTFAQAHPAFDRRGWGNASAYQDRYLSKQDGTFRIVGLPGRGLIGALVIGQAYVQGAGFEAIPELNRPGLLSQIYQNPLIPTKNWPTVMKEIKPPAEAEVVRVDLQVLTGGSVRLKVVDADGKPVVGTSTIGLSGSNSRTPAGIATDEGEVTNLKPRDERVLLIRHDARKIGKVVSVHKGDDADGPVVVKLEPLAKITGRAIDEEGRPVAGIGIRPILGYSLTLPQVSTDDRGRFELLDVPAGFDCTIYAQSGGPGKGRSPARVEVVKVKPGETTVVGDLIFKKD